MVEMLPYDLLVYLLQSHFRVKISRSVVAPIMEAVLLTLDKLRRVRRPKFWRLELTAITRPSAWIEGDIHARARIGWRPRTR